MKGALAAAAALLLAAPAAAQDKPAWVGVWEGRVGSYPVRACFDAWNWGAGGRGRGSYYYLSQLEPIALGDEESDGAWTEQAAGGGATATWDFAEQSAARMRGTWRQGDRSLAFSLTPVAWTEGEWGGACSAEAFLGPRLRDVAQVRLEPAELGSFRYDRHTFVPPAQFRDDVTIETFQFEAERPGDPAILAALRARLPSGSVKDGFADCLGGAIAANGVDGYFTEIVVPVMAAPEFLVVRESSENYCGGAHPNAYYRHLTFDRQSGAEVDLFTWLTAEASEQHQGDSTVRSYFIVLPALREVIVAREPSDDFPMSDDSGQPAYDQECRDIVQEQEFWSLGLSRAGLLFVPSVPHVATPCMATFTVPWDELAPFLNAAGRAGRARLREGRKAVGE